MAHALAVPLDRLFGDGWTLPQPWHGVAVAQGWRTAPAVRPIKADEGARCRLPGAPHAWP